MNLVDLLVTLMWPRTKLLFKAGAVDAMRHTHVVLEVVAVLKGPLADGAGLSLLLLVVGVNVLNVSLEAATVEELATEHAGRPLAYNTAQKG